MPDITIAGATYPDVPAIVVPKAGGGSAKYVAETGIWGDPSFDDVNFFDYDGTLLYSYTAAEFATLIEMPPNPAHDGLTAQGWNWTLENAKNYVAEFGFLDIGQTYITDDGKTRIYIRLTAGRLSPYVGFATNGSVDIDWGDGTAHATVTGSSLNDFQNTQHTYTSPGDYVIKLTVTSGTMDIWGVGSGSRLVWGTVGNNDPYRSIVTKVELGANITYIGTSCFDGCRSMESITIPRNAGFVVATYVFYNCQSLKHVTLPIDMPSILNSQWFYNCCSMRSVSLPASVTTFGGTAHFHVCQCLRRFCMPSGITAIPSIFMAQAMSQTKIVIPSTVTDFNGEQNFVKNYCLKEVHFRPTTPPTIANSNAWNDLPTDCVIYVPTGSLSDYTSATNYPDPNTYTYAEE